MFDGTIIIYIEFLHLICIQNLVGNKIIPPFFTDPLTPIYVIFVRTCAEMALVCGPTEEFSKTFTYYCSSASDKENAGAKLRFWAKTVMPHHKMSKKCRFCPTRHAFLQKMTRYCGFGSKTW